MYGGRSKQPTTIGSSSNGGAQKYGQASVVGGGSSQFGRTESQEDIIGVKKDVEVMSEQISEHDMADFRGARPNSKYGW